MPRPAHPCKAEPCLTNKYERCRFKLLSSHHYCSVEYFTMETASICDKLTRTSVEESGHQSNLRKRARQIIAHRGKDNSNLPEVLLDLLTTVIKPLFAASRNAALTSSGRKNLVPQAPATGRFDSSFLDDDAKPWKNGWTVDLLTYILTSYSGVCDTQQRNTIEAHFHLLVPPILNLIDDGETVYKADGCRLLRLLCDVVKGCRSDIFKRTGLTDVFVDALRTNFMVLPTLTPEQESLALMQELYPAYRALVAARFPMHVVDNNDKVTPLPPSSGTAASSKTTTSPFSISSQRSGPPAVQDAAESQVRQSLLDILLLQGLLAALSHLGAGTSSSSTISLTLTTYLISQLTPTVSDMGISTVKHLQTLLPLLRNILSDPFGAVAPRLLLEALATLDVIIAGPCRPRIQDRWWPECLRALVACWCVVIDELEDENENSSRGQNEDKVRELHAVKTKLQDVTARLGGVVGRDFMDAKNRLIEEETDLEGLFRD